MLNNEPNVLDNIPPILPRHSKPDSRILSYSKSVLSSEDLPSDESFDLPEDSVDQSPRMVGVASLRNRFS